MKKWFLFCVLVAVYLLTACADEEKNPLPYVRVNFSIGIYMDINLMNGYPTKVPGHGYQGNGVIIVPPRFSNEGYKAFDATCTRNINEETRSVNVNPGEAFTATCLHSKCGTVYHLLYDGYDQTNSFHLQRYKAYESNGRVFVTN